MESQRNECLEAAGLVLQRAQLHQVINTVFVILDVTVEHGRVRTEPELVSHARRIEPLLTVQLVVTDDSTHAVGKYFCAAAGKRVHSRELHFLERLTR